MKIEINNFELGDETTEELLKLKFGDNKIKIKINDKTIFNGRVINIETNLETLTGVDKLKNDCFNTNDLLDPISKALNFIIKGENT